MTRAQATRGPDPSSRHSAARLASVLACAAAGATVFQFFGNATQGYIHSTSLFYWWGFQWFDPLSETEHGLIILPLAIGLFVWNLRTTPAAGKNSDLECEPSSLTAVAAMVGGLALHVVGFETQQARLSIVALLVFTWGVSRQAGGRRWGDAALFPLAFMVFAIPINALDSAGFWLRLWVIRASAGLAHGMGIGVVQSGTQLMAPDGSFQYDVAAACSGVRSLVALLALSLLIGYLGFRSVWRRAVMVLLCFPLIYLGNILRITSIIVVAQWRGQAWGKSAHDVMGYGVFVIVLGGVLLAAKGMTEKKEEESHEGKVRKTHAERGVRRTAIGRWAWVGVVFFAGGEMLLLAHLMGLPPRGRVGVRLAADGKNPVELPAFLGTDWIGQASEVTPVERELLPPDTGYSRKEYVAFANPAQGVFLSLVLSGRDRTSIHRPELCLVGQGWTLGPTMEHRFAYPGKGGGRFPATILRVQRAERTAHGTVVTPALVAYWFIDGDMVVASHWQRLAVDAWNRLIHARADRWAYVLMLTDARDGDAAALGRMQAILDQTLPVFASPLVAR